MSGRYFLLELVFVMLLLVKAELQRSKRIFLKAQQKRLMCHIFIHCLTMLVFVQIGKAYYMSIWEKDVY